MMRLFFILAVLFCWSVSEANACESCLIGQLGRNRSAVETASKDQKWFFKYTFEQQDWDKKPAAEIHALHHAGHHAHDKVKEEFYHFELGAHLTPELTLHAELPYIARHYLEVDNHHRLGAQETSQGLGDLSLIGDYRLWNKDAQSLSGILGVRFPTGATDEVNSSGTKVEAELQPGTGSYDYIIGGAWKNHREQWFWGSNLLYVIKTPGSQEFENGDVVSTTAYAEYLLNPDQKNWKVKIGADANLQYAQKSREHDSRVEDSGGTTLLLGPILKIETTPQMALMGAFLYPVHQDLGGVHQELDFAWTAGGQLKW
jgi:hypothetical protein